MIEKKAATKGPKRGKRGDVDDQGRIWIKDAAHAGDESLDGGEYTLEIEGPTVYLIFRLEDLAKPRQALRFLQSAAPPPDRDQFDPDLPDSDEALTLGTFGPASVSFFWDNETYQRCFLVVGPWANSTWNPRRWQPCWRNIVSVNFGRRTRLAADPDPRKPMARLLVHVEGVTEEMFVNEVLARRLRYRKRCMPTFSGNRVRTSICRGSFPT